MGHSRLPLGGHITSVHLDYTTVSGQLQAGALRPLAIGSAIRTSIKVE